MAITRSPYIVVFHGGKPGFHWHIRAANGEIICQGEGHMRKADAERAAKNVVRRIGGSGIRVGVGLLTIKFYKESSRVHGEVIRWGWST